MKAGTLLLVIVALVLFLVAVMISSPPAKAQVPSITLDWTAPGDDGNVGTATTYEMRWHTTRPDTTSSAAFDLWWNGATPVAAMPAPMIAGTAQSKIVPGPFPTGATYYFVLKACDEIPNCSPYSNVASKFLPDAVAPSRIFDLRVR